jgi:NhaA family Na+:H+ antiporter
MKLTKLFKDFFNSSKSGGIVLLVCTIISIILTNSVWQEYYTSIWEFEFANHTTAHLINDGLMAVFFLLVGLELEREVYIGELSNIKNSLLPIIAAIGGMLVPASIHLLLNYGTQSQAGAGIPMATDIAFALGVLSLLGNRVPASVKVFLTALAVIDDLGAILVIAIFYTGTIQWTNLIIALTIFGGLLVLNRLKVYNLIPYLVAGVAMWYFMHHSGIHATISGVLLAFAIPFGNGSEKSTSYVLQHVLHKPVVFIILPLFALANTSIVLQPNWYESLIGINSLGISLGLILGKPLGILVFSYAAIAIGIARFPEDMAFKEMLGIGLLAGIGFTMSIFVTLLAFGNNYEFVAQSKMAIMLSSLLAGCLGFMVLKWCLKNNVDQNQ